MGQSCNRNRGEPIASLAYSREDIAVLTIIRHYCTSFAIPDRQSWIAAISGAMADFGGTRGPDIAVAALGVMQTVRRSRRSDFIFNTADCPTCATFVTGHERLVMSILRATARGQTAAATAHATLLCEGNDPAAVVMAVDMLQDKLAPTRSRTARPAGAPGMDTVPSAGS